MISKFVSVRPERCALRAVLCLLLALAALAVAAFSARAAGPPPPPVPAGYVTDGANVLSAGARAELETKLRDFEAATSNQFLVWTSLRIPEGTTLEEFTVTAAQAWGAGRKDRKNGLVLFVFPESRRARFEVGYGLEGALPDALAGRILSEEATPRFRGGDYEGGIRAAVDSAIAATKGEYKGSGRRPGGRPVRRGFPWQLVVFILVFFVFPALFGRRRGGGFWWGGPWLGGGGGGGWGGGGGGGFSGGGGGFGGGGASGDW